MNLALFDFDGTITTTDTFTSFLRFAIRPGRAALGALLLSPLVLGYRLGKIPASRARPAAARVGFWRERPDAVKDLGRRYAREVLPGVLRQQALDRIQWHQRQGDLVIVVSASLDVYLDPWCQAVGVERICTELEERNGRLTGRYCHGDCSGSVKVRRILERYDVSRYPVIYAYGDTPEDREMLDLAHRKYYRWREIRDWSDVGARDRGHPRASDGRRRGGSVG